MNIATNSKENRGSVRHNALVRSESGDMAMNTNSRIWPNRRAMVNSVIAAMASGLGLGSVSAKAQTFPDSPNIDLLSSPPIGVKYVNRLYERQFAGPGVEFEVLNLSGLGGGYIDFLQLACRWDSIIRIYVDGEATPSIAMPANMFFAALYGAFSGTTFSGEAFAARWFVCGQAGDQISIEGTTWLPIPFSSSIRVTLTHRSGNSLLANISCQTGLSNTWARTRRLHITSRSFLDGNHIDDVIVLVDAQGINRGRLAGIYFNIDSGPGNADPPTGPLEGNFRVYADGTSAPIMGSSGVEDFLGLGFYFRTFTAPVVYGDRCLSMKSPCDRSVTWAGHRMFLQDPIGFNRGIKVTWQCGESSSGVPFTGTVRFSYTVWYYTE
jgi:hypothetical protein